MAGLLLEFFKLLFILSLNLKLHLGQFDLVLVLGLRDFVLEHGAVVAPLVELEVVDDGLLLDVVVCVDVLGDFADGALACSQLLLRLGSQLIHGCLHVLHRLVHHFLVLLLEV